MGQKAFADDRVEGQLSSLRSEEYFQRAREAISAIGAGEPTAALAHIRKVIELALVAQSRTDDPGNGHVLQFAEYAARQADVLSVRKLREYSARRLVLLGDPIPSELRFHKKIERCEARAVRNAESKSPGIRKEDPDREIGSYSVPATPLSDAFDRRARSADEWEAIRTSVDTNLAEERVDGSLTYSDFVGHYASADLTYTAGMPIMLDDDHNALGFGHLPLESFHKAAQKPYRDGAREPERGWNKNKARHTWAVGVRRDYRGGIVVREVPRDEPLAVAITAITTPNRNIDPAGAFRDLHTWLTDTGRTQNREEWSASESEDGLRGTLAIRRLETHCGAPDLEFPQEKERRWVTKLQFDATEGGGIGVRLENVVPIQDIWSETLVKAWLLGPERETVLAESRQAASKGEPWHPGRHHVLISAGGQRLVMADIEPERRPDDPPGTGGWKVGWTEIPLRDTVSVGGCADRRVTTLTSLVEERLTGAPASFVGLPVEDIDA
ncbi:hypothetical protein [Arthrobacter sp. 131MFCol6.1]|uniref:hypothetical protein n=1 Tax=Arthrobacter sp. 131MFCol6.1 TaxID=1157944 RepID=UPI0012DCA093|nr:hypothetical protein [Arthrobacter sp. 131MFCol6.1]